MNNLRWLWWLSLVLLMGACKTTDEFAIVKLKKRPAKFLLKKIEKNKIDYKWFAGKGKIKLKDKSNNITFATYIRMRKDSLIWIVARKMNIEGGRIQITPQKIEILDRQNKQYISKPFAALKTEYNLDLSFNELQEILIGNPVLYQEVEFSAGADHREHILNHKTKKEQLRIGLYDKSFLISSFMVEKDRRFLEVDYSDYTPTATNQQIAHTKRLEVEAEETGSVSLKISLTKVELDVLQRTPFKVPDSYERVN
ncbi:MAG: DUF4292 domain-containing protein [Aureispira sp.]|nr:DUF4292 domain-containing protein [Aureispira sp.]